MLAHAAVSIKDMQVCSSVPERCFHFQGILNISFSFCLPPEGHKQLIFLLLLHTFSFFKASILLSALGHF